MAKQASGCIPPGGANIDISVYNNLRSNNGILGAGKYQVVDTRREQERRP